MQIWEQFLKDQESELGRETVQKWLYSLKVLRYDARNLYLEAKDSFQALWFEEHIRGIVQTKLVNGNNAQIRIHLSLANEKSDSKKKQYPPKKNKTDFKSTEFQLSFDELDPLCLFKHFIIGQDNELTYKFLIELTGYTQGPKPEAFNPIYLHGPTGSGKTHLLMSLTHHFKTQNLRTLYVRAELFTDHVVKAIRAGEMSTFRQAYRTADILLVDDIHVFSRKGATQEEFFHTFNTLHLEGKQIILSANCSPQELQLIEPRLVSRFEWGIVLPLKALQIQDLKNLLHTKAQALQFHLPTKIVDFLIEFFSRHPKILIKALEALMLRLHLDSHHSIQNLSIIAVRTLLSDLLLEEEKAAITYSKIIQAVAEHYGIRQEDVMGKSQTRECVLPRQIAVHLCRTKLKMPFMKIGDLFSRDHSTIMTSVKLIQKALDQDNREISGALHSILKKLEN